MCTHISECRYQYLRVPGISKHVLQKGTNVLVSHIIFVHGLSFFQCSDELNKASIFSNLRINTGQACAHCLQVRLYGSKRSCEMLGHTTLKAIASLVVSGAIEDISIKCTFSPLGHQLANLCEMVNERMLLTSVSKILKKSFEAIAEFALEVCQALRALYSIQQQLTFFSLDLHTLTNVYVLEVCPCKVELLERCHKMCPRCLPASDLLETRRLLSIPNLQTQTHELQDSVQACCFLDSNAAERVTISVNLPSAKMILSACDNDACGIHALIVLVLLCEPFSVLSRSRIHAKIIDAMFNLAEKVGNDLCIFFAS
mmetsp:Transcript_66420/g.104994  ORF Transcript_66420/g.104994 Transcript_66420/m.104994 type:complete len:314 (+) Transcript_66420:524-1465(+)